MRHIIILSLITSIFLFSACNGSNFSNQQQTSAPEITSADFSSKTYAFASDVAESKGMEGADVKMIFNKDTTGTIRLIKGGTMYQIGFSWHIDGDSLRMGQIDEKTLKAKSTTIVYQLPPASYLINKEQGGYLLIGKAEQIVLSRSKD